MIGLIQRYYAGADSKQYIVGRPLSGERPEDQVPRPHYFFHHDPGSKVSGGPLPLREKVAAKEIATLQEFLREAKRLAEDFTRKLEELEV